jgi:hypothetical protein
VLWKARRGLFPANRNCSYQASDDGNKARYNIHGRHRAAGMSLFAVFKYPDDVAAELGLPYLQVLRLLLGCEPCFPPFSFDFDCA